MRFLPLLFLVGATSLSDVRAGTQMDSVIEQIVPGGTIKEKAFRHGSRLTGYYKNGRLVDISHKAESSAESYDSTRDLVHPGIDIAAVDGSEVYAVASGRVHDVIATSVDPLFTSLGYMVMISHSGGVAPNTWTIYSLYLHLQEPPLVEKQDPVVGGQTLIGKVG